MPSVLDLLRRPHRREPPAPPITSLVGLALALRSVAVALGAATAACPSGRRRGGIGLMDLDEYAVQWLVRQRLRQARGKAATQAQFTSGPLPLHRQARVLVGRALIRAGHRVAGQAAER